MTNKLFEILTFILIVLMGLFGAAVWYYTNMLGALAVFFLAVLCLAVHHIQSLGDNNGSS